MNIIYIANNAPKSWLKKIVENEIPISIPAYKFNDLIIKGLQMNKANVHVPVDYHLCEASGYDYSEGIIEEQGVKYYILPKYISKIQKIFTIYKFIMDKLKQNKDTYILCDSLLTLPTLVSMLCARIAKIKIVGIFTDLPQFLHADKTDLLSRLKDKFIMHFYNKFDGYVLLTEEMKYFVNKKEKPFIVMEGLVDSEEKLEKVEKISENKICLYAGAIHEIYGIDTLVKAFLKSHLHDVELHIYGSGDYAEKLKEICKDNENIKYFGVVPNEKIVAAEKKASLLINPRPANEEFTKYSFPSKNMEYMLSGTPVLTTKLPGMPREYFEYVFLAEDETTEGMAKTISMILSKNGSELKDFGKSAQEFVLKEKNNIFQTKKIVNLLNRLK